MQWGVPVFDACDISVSEIVKVNPLGDKGSTRTEKSFDLRPRL